MRFLRLESVRGFAAFYVLLGHLFLGDQGLGPAELLLRFAQEAVMVFFILSGFVVCWASLAPGRLDELKPMYFRKRFIRIYSVWALAILALFAIASLEAGRPVYESTLTMLGNLFMLQDFQQAKPAVICDVFYGNTPLWSLHYEWWFYMLFPVIMFVPGMDRRQHLVGIMGIIASINYAISPNPASRIFIYLTIWWIGAHAAFCHRRSGQVFLRDLFWPLMYAALTSLPILTLAVVMYYQDLPLSAGNHPLLESRHLLSAVFITLLAFGWRKVKWIGFQQTFGIFRYLAPISFSLYVIHYKSITTATYLSWMDNKVLECLCYFALTLVFCWFTELVVFKWLKQRFT